MWLGHLGWVMGVYAVCSSCQRTGWGGLWWRMVKAGGVTKARTGPNWKDAGFSWGRRRWDRGVTSRQGLSETALRTTPTQLFLFQHPSACFSLSPFLTPSVSLYLSPPLFFSFQNALLTKRFTNPGWYIIHDRLLWDWFKQMDSEREVEMEGGVRGKDGKGESEKGCVPQCNRFTKPPHGLRWIFPFLLHFERPYIKCSLYSLYVQGEAPSLWGLSGWGWAMIFLHMHAWSIFRGILDMYDIITSERFDFHKAWLRRGRVCLLQ